MRSRYALFLVPVLLLAACRPQVGSPDAESAAPPPVMAREFSGQYTAMDPAKSSIDFVGASHGQVIEHPSTFTDFDVQLKTDATAPADLTKAELMVAIAMDSVESDGDRITEHLKKAEFFDVENHPKATFVSDAISKNADGSYNIAGDLTIKGVTKAVTVSGVRVSDDGMALQFDVIRKDFGVGNDSYGNKLLNDTVPVNVTIVFQKDASAEDAAMELDAMMQQE